MNDTFSPVRLGQYLLHDIRHNMRTYGFGLLLLGLLPVIMLLLSLLLSLFSEDPVRMGADGRTVIFGFAIWGLTLSYPSRSYGHLTNKRKGSEWLMLPASMPEKFTSMMLISIVLLPLSMILLYLGSDALICWLDPHGSSSIASGIAEVMRNNSSIEVTNGTMLMLIFNSIWQSVLFFLLGALFFKKRKIVGTILVLMGLNVLIIVLIQLFVHIIPDISALKNLILSASDEAARHFVVAMVSVSTLFTMALATGVFFRLKTLKH
ncbi:MAG: hypothetical protein IJU72_07650 [Bacteroidales bacterium]|nr:hypothetical protein [Bacteroidales bacterium]